MAQHDFSALEQEYQAVIAQMGKEFTAHEFILRLGRQNQCLYIEALNTYRNNPAPFQAVHKELATRLNKFPQLVDRISDEPDSFDIWTNPQSCSKWRKK